jgi:hypothetical protein
VHACNPSLNGPLPTRTLDVGTTNRPLLRLYTPSHVEAVRYLALSHRWGDQVIHKAFCTTNATVADMHRSIAIEALPRTFRDAIIITRALGVRYIWIDSLCIIQDDENDWRIEAERMENVFENAYCVLAATRAKGSSEGFLGPRPVREFVQLREPAGDEYYICEDIDDFSKDVEESDLSQRGWVLQERALAHRTIFYTKRQVYWECGHGIQCETLTRMRK